MTLYYKSNAFRVLGISGSSARPEVLDAYQSHRARARVGGPQSSLDLLSFYGPCDQSEQSLRDALTRLESPQSRLRERLFWFSYDSKVAKEISKLTTKEVAHAVDLITKAGDLTSRFNAAIWEQAQCIARDPLALEESAWQKALIDWRMLFGLKEFWEWFDSLEAKSVFEPRATPTEMQSLQNDAWQLLLGFSKERMITGIEDGRPSDISGHLRLVQSVCVPAPEAYRLIKDLVDPLESTLEEATEQIIKVLKSSVQGDVASLTQKREASDLAYESWNAAIIPLLSKVRLVAGEDSEASKMVSEKAATCLRDIAVVGYHNAADAYEVAEQLLREAEVMAPDTITSGRVQQDLKVVTSHIEQQNRAQVFAPLSSLVNNIMKRLPEQQEGAPPSESTKQLCRDSFALFRKEVTPALGTIVTATSDPLTMRDARQMVGNALRYLARTYFSNGGTAQGAITILRHAQQLVPGTDVLGAINKDLEDLAALAHREAIYSSVKPIESAPSMYTLNGCGTHLYGQTDLDTSTGSFISTLYFVLLFVPIVPLARYRVSSSDGKSYRFYGKAPFRTFDKIHLGIFCAAIVCAILYSGLWGSSHATVYVDNAYSTSVTLSISGLDPIVAPPGLKAIRLSPGQYDLSYLGNQRRMKITSSGIWMLNLGGLNSYKWYTVVYGSSTVQPTVRYIGNPEFFEAHADYILETPPKSIQASAPQTKIVIEHISRIELQIENDKNKIQAMKNT